VRTSRSAGVVTVLAAGSALLLISACSGSSGSETPATSPPVTGRPVSSTPASTSAAPSTSAPASTSPRPTPTRSVGLSRFEADPAVKALRAWAAELGRTVNSGHITRPALNRLMTSFVKKNMKAIDGGEQGHLYPGPLPFKPLSVHDITPTRRFVNICVLAGGYSEHPNTHKVWTKRNVLPILAAAERDNGRWIVSQFSKGSFSCKDVAIPTPSY
jgi:hypothetical protein